MTRPVRGVLALVTGVATFYFAGWIGAALLSLLSAGVFGSSLALIISAFFGVMAARHVLRTSSQPNDDSFRARRAALTGALVLGGIGFSAGFFGPMIFAPHANQGPLLGIFITGPLSVIAGAIGGYVYGLHRKHP